MEQLYGSLKKLACSQRNKLNDQEAKVNGSREHARNDYGLRRNHRSAEDHARRERNEMLKVGIILEVRDRGGKLRPSQSGHTTS